MSLSNFQQLNVHFCTGTFISKYLIVVEEMLCSLHNESCPIDCHEMTPLFLKIQCQMNLESASQCHQLHSTPLTKQFMEKNIIQLQAIREI